MVARQYEVGDVVLSRMDMYNDGGVPDAEDGALLARAGTRGIVVRVGGAQGRHKRAIYLVRFEGSDQLLGPPIGCLQEELTQNPAECQSGAADERSS
jgi:nitrogen fixation protein NifZ